MKHRLLLILIATIACINLPANSLRIDTIRYYYDSDYMNDHPFEGISYFDSLLITDTLTYNEKCWILFNKGITLSINNETESALKCFYNLLEFDSILYIPKPDLYTQIGYTYENNYEYIKAEKYFFKALNSMQIDDSSRIASCFNSIGRVNYGAGIYEKAVKYLIRSNSLASKTNDTAQFLSSSVNLGMVYSLWGQNEKAIQVYNQALSFIKQDNYSDYQSLLYSNLGVSYFYLKEHHLALSYYERALKIELMSNNKMDIAGSYHNIGNVYEVLGNYNQALDFYLKALNIQNSINDFDGLVLTTHDIGITYSYIDEMDMAFDNVMKSLTFAKNHNFVRQEMQAYKTLSELHAKEGKYDTAYEFQLLFNELKDSLFNSDKNTEIARQQAIFDSEKQKSEIELLSKEKEIINAKIEQHKIVIGSFIVLTFLLLIALIVGYRAFVIKRKANIILKEQERKIVEITNKVLKQNDNLIDNLEYGKVIQKAVLAGKTDLHRWFSETYFINQPQLIVSGDFFWSKSMGNKLYIVMADCTGHGVPGGFMSMLGVAFLNDLTTDKFKLYPDELLNNLRDRVKYALNQSDFRTETHDGMDLACCLFDFDENIMHFSGAHMAIWHHNSEELTKHKGDLMPIGVCVKEKPFSKAEIPFKKGDEFYLFTDGIIDQCNTEGERYTSARLTKLLTKTRNSGFENQKLVLQSTFFKWKGEAAQTDDSLFLGLKI